MLSARGLSCVRDGRVLFEDLQLRIEAPEAVALHGANGAGKSTLLRCIAGLYPDYEGELQVASFVYAGHKAGLCGYLSVAENLRFLAALDDAAATHGAETGVADAREPLVNELHAALDKVSLPGYEDVRCNALSAGQLRRVALARLLRARAPLWLLDEPLTALDESGATLLGTLLSEHIAAGGAALCATHQPLPGITQRSVTLTGLTQSQPGVSTGAVARVPGKSD